LKNVTFHLIIDPTKTEFKAALEIYEYSFPSNEKQSQETLINRLTSGQERLIIGKIKEDVMAIAFLFDLLNTNFLVLDYFAISEKLRGKGFGSYFFKHLNDTAQSQSKNLLMEVDHPSFGTEIDKRRVMFYEKNGAKILKGIPYILPPLDDTLPTRQVLMSMNQKTEITKKEKQNLVENLYQQLYFRKIGDYFLDQILENIC
jgi:hypothetical protein